MSVLDKKASDCTASKKRKIRQRAKRVSIEDGEVLCKPIENQVKLLIYVAS